MGHQSSKSGAGEQFQPLHCQAKVGIGGMILSQTPVAHVGPASLHATHFFYFLNPDFDPACWKATADPSARRIACLRHATQRTMPSQVYRSGSCRCAMIGVPWCLRRLSLFSTFPNMFLTNKSPQAKHAETDPCHGAPRTAAHFQPPKIESAPGSGVLPNSSYPPTYPPQYAGQSQYSEDGQAPPPYQAVPPRVRPISEVRFWISEGLTQAES